MKKRTKRWLRYARNAGITLGVLIAVWFIIKSAAPNTNYAIKDKYFHRRSADMFGKMRVTDDISVICDPDTEIAHYELSSLMAGEVEGVTYTDALFVLNDRYYVQNEDILSLLVTKEIGGYGEVTLVGGAHAPLAALLPAAEKETASRFTRGSSYIPSPNASLDIGDDCYLSAYHDTSEHAWGLGVDLLIDGVDTHRYMTHPLAKWLQDHAWEYGFAVRYPFWEAEWTGVSFQPWHIRYVGEVHAAYMYAHRLSLEEYLDTVFSDGMYYLWDMTRTDGTKVTYVIFFQRAYEKTVYIPTTLTDVEISFDNTAQNYYVWGILK